MITMSFIIIVCVVDWKKGVIWDRKVKGQLWDAIDSLTITLLKSKRKYPGMVYVGSINQMKQ